MELDAAIDTLASAIIDVRCSLVDPNNFSGFLGRINYCFSRILMRVMRDVSYKNIAMATGVLENIKQEFYDRVARQYENRKIAQTGDIPEYKKWS